MSDEWDIIEAVAAQFLPKINNAFNDKMPIDNTFLDPKVSNEYIHDLIACILEHGASLSKTVTNSDDKEFIDKLVRLYEDSKISIDNSVEFEHINNVAESRITSDNIISKQIKLIGDRNTEAAVKSLELSFLYCDNVLSHLIETGAKVMEQTIPQLRQKIEISRKEFADAHNSLPLLDPAVYANYCVLRDGYVDLTKKFYLESTKQLSITSSLERETNAQHLTRLTNAIHAFQNDEAHVTAREKVNLQFSQLINRVSDITFQHLETSSHFDEMDKMYGQLEAVKESIFKWKQRIQSHGEDALNTAVSAIDNTYLTHVEELTDRLHVMETAQTRLYSYERNLEHNCETLECLRRQEEWDQSRIQGRVSVERDERFLGQHGGDEIVDAEIRAFEIVSSSLRIGTRLHASALALCMSDEEIVQLLLQMI